MNIITAYQTKNDCYKAAKKMTPAGIVVHSTGTNNPKLSRYVDCPEELGNPASKNWNRAGVEKMVHGFIGYDKNSNVAVVNTMPYNYCAWGCGAGSKGSYNYKPPHIQFEICEDDLADEVYFTSAFEAAIEYCAYLCKTYNLAVNSIVSHAEAHKQGYASNHSDVGHWLKKFGKDMDWFRAQVDAKMNPGEDDKDLAYVPWIGRVNARSVNRRTGPSVDTKSLGTVHKGEEYKVVSEAPVDEYGSVWVELDGQMGWINKRYLDFVAMVETPPVEVEIQPEPTPEPTPTIEATPTVEVAPENKDNVVTETQTDLTTEDIEKMESLLTRILSKLISWIIKLFTKK